MDELNDELLAASGYVYRSGYRTVPEFVDKFGFEPNRYPQYFTVSKTGLVCVTDRFCRATESHFAKVRYIRLRLLASV